MESSSGVEAVDVDDDADMAVGAQAGTEAEVLAGTDMADGAGDSGGGGGGGGTNTATIVAGVLGAIIAVAVIAGLAVAARRRHQSRSKPSGGTSGTEVPPWGHSGALPPGSHAGHVNSVHGAPVAVVRSQPAVCGHATSVHSPPCLHSCFVALLRTFADHCEVPLARPLPNPHHRPWCYRPYDRGSSAHSGCV